jgi:hypothetical protein
VPTSTASQRNLLLALAILTACEEPTRGCDVCTYSAIVYGTVTNSSGAPVDGAFVRAHSAMSPCSEGQFSITTQVVSSEGRFRIQVGALAPAPVCVQIEVASPSGAFPSQRVDVPQVRFKLTADASLPYDSVNVDVRLQ